jgi:hypothetical protein
MIAVGRNHSFRFVQTIFLISRVELRFIASMICVKKMSKVKKMKDRLNISNEEEKRTPLLKKKMSLAK